MPPKADPHQVLRAKAREASRTSARTQVTAAVKHLMATSLLHGSDTAHKIGQTGGRVKGRTDCGADIGG